MQVKLVFRVKESFYYYICTFLLFNFVDLRKLFEFAKRPRTRYLIFSQLSYDVSFVNMFYLHKPVRDLASYGGSPVCVGINLSYLIGQEDTRTKAGD